MNVYLKNLLTAAALALVVVVPSYAQAQDAECIIPENEMGQRRLGFNGQYNGFGMEVLSVSWGSRAQRMGLEVGDVVVEVNGIQVQSYPHYLHLLRNSGNFVRLTIQDVRSGNWVLRSTRFGPSYPSGVAASSISGG